MTDAIIEMPKLKIHSVTLTSDGSGDASSTTEMVSGFIRRIRIDPDGTAVPSAAFDVTITDSDGVQVYQNLTCSATATTDAAPTVNPHVCSGAMSIVGANMGAAKIAVVKLFVSGDA